MTDLTPDEVREALRPLASLISKSEKAQTKVAPGTWQHTMLGNNLRALHLAVALMDAAAVEPAAPTEEEARDSLRALADMIARTEAAGAKFAPGTSQHSLSRNRLKALRIAEDFVRRRV